MSSKAPHANYREVHKILNHLIKNFLKNEMVQSTAHGVPKINLIQSHGGKIKIEADKEAFDSEPD